MSQSESDVLKRKVKKWAEEDGLKPVQFKLVRNGLSFSLAYQLSVGRYKPEIKVRRIIDGIHKAMA